MTEKFVPALSKSLSRDKSLTAEQESTRLAQEKNRNRHSMLSILKDVGKSGHLETIIAAEKLIVLFELKEYANSKNMASSLSAAQKDLESIETNIGLVDTPKLYQKINLSHVQPKVRDANDLPLDSARIAFRSHKARLVNYDKTKSDNHEKAIIQARRQNMQIAEKRYIERQLKALGRKHD